MLHNINSIFRNKGFTLIELSVVLVIIGLIIGGVLVGRDLIKTAQIRSQISQIEQYNTTVHTFKLKYGYLPGDIKDPEATGFGFTARGIYAGTGDGNSIIEGITAYAPSSNAGNRGASGEATLFWRDLTDARLLKGKSLSTATANILPAGLGTSNVSRYFPNSVMGSQNSFIQIFSAKGKNYYSLQNFDSFIAGFAACNSCVSANLTVNEAYRIDKKIDDSLPGTGNIKASFGFSNQEVIWIGLPTGDTLPLGSSLRTAASCYDNNNVATVTQQYSIPHNGDSINCWLLIGFK